MWIMTGVGLLLLVYLAAWVRNVRYLRKAPEAKLAEALRHNENRTRVVRLCRTDRTRLRA